MPLVFFEYIDTSNHYHPAYVKSPRLLVDPLESFPRLDSPYMGSVKDSYIYSKRYRDR